MEINNKILEEYFSYLTVIKARSPHTIAEFRIDLRMLFIFVYKKRKPSATAPSDCSFADIKFIKSITLDEIYAFIAYLQKERNCTIATWGRKIIAWQKKENTLVPSLQRELADVEKSLANVMAAIEQGILTSTTKNRMSELESMKTDLEVKIAKEEIQK